MFLGLGAHSVLVSHRIAGPLYQLRRLLSAVADGNLAVRAVLRERDYLGVEGTIINDMIEKTGARIAEIEGCAGELRSGLGNLRTAIDGGSTEQTREHLRTLDQRSDALQAVLRQFTTRPDASPKA